MSSKLSTPARKRSSLLPPTLLQKLSPTTDSIVALEFSPSGKYLAVALQYGTILLYVVQRARTLFGDNPPLQPRPVRTFRGHKADVINLSFSPTHFLASASMGRSVRLWHPDSSTCLRNLPQPDMATSVSFNPVDDNLLLTGCCDGAARIWGLTESRIVCESQAGNVVTTATFTSSRRAAVGTYDRRLLEWRPQGSVSGLSGNLQSPNAIVLDVRSQKRSTPQAAKLSSVVVHGDDAKRRRTYVTTEGGRFYSMWGNTLMRSVKAEKSRKVSTALNVSASTDGRFVMLDAVGETVRILDLAGRKRDYSKKISEPDVVGIVEVPAFRDGVQVTSAVIAPESVRRRCGRGRVIGAAVMMAVGGGDGSITIIEQCITSI